MLLEKLEISSATVPRLPWDNRPGENNMGQPGPWFLHTANRPLLDNPTAYPPPQLMGMRLTINGVSTILQNGNWELVIGGVQNTLYLGTPHTTAAGTNTRSRARLSVPQRALLLLSILETAEFADVPEGAIEKVQELLLKKLTTKEQAGWLATVTRLNVKPPVRTGVQGIGLVADDLVVLTGEKWLKADGAEAAVPELLAKFA